LEAKKERKKGKEGRKEGRNQGRKLLWVAKLLGAYQPQESFFSSLPLNL
jgi:hypothetical protein